MRGREGIRGGRDPGARATALAVVALAVVALAARLAARDWLLPHYPEPDRYLVAQVDWLESGGTLREAPMDFWWYPSLVAEALAAWPRGAAGEPETPAEHARAALAPVLRARTAVAWLAALAVPLTYVLARRFLRRGASLLAAALLATSLLHLSFSTQARLHAVEATAALAAVLGALRVAERGRWRDYLLAGLGSAAAVGVLQNGVFALPALGVAHLLRPRAGGEWTVLAPRALARLGVALFLVALVAMRFHPYFFVEERGDQRRAYTELALRDGSLELGPQRLELERFDGSGFARLPLYVLWNDPVLLVLGAVGAGAWVVARALRRGSADPAGGRGGGQEHAGADPGDRPPRVARARSLAVVLAYAAPHALVLGSYRHTWGRFLLPLYPHLAVLAAYGAAALGDAVGALVARRRGAPGSGPASLGASDRGRPDVRGRIAGTAGAALVLALPAAVTARFVALRARPDTFEEAAVWVAAHLDPARDRLVTTPGLFPPLFLDDASLEELVRQPFYRLANTFARETYWLAHQRALPPARRPEAWRLGTLHVPRGAEPDEVRARVDALVAELRPTWALLERSGRMRSFQRLELAITHLLASAEPVAYLDPHPGRDLPWLDYQDQPWAFARLLRQRALGPPIGIWRLGP